MTLAIFAAQSLCIEYKGPPVEQLTSFVHRFTAVQVQRGPKRKSSLQFKKQLYLNIQVKFERGENKAL